MEVITSTLSPPGHWIGGHWVTSADTFTDISPIDEEPIADVPRGGPAEVDAAVAAAREAFPHWAATPAAERAAILHRIADLVQERVEPLART